MATRRRQTKPTPKLKSNPQPRLTPKQQMFIAEYLKCFNATQAAKTAGYSERTAYSIGQENLKKPEIADIIRAGIEERTMGKDELLVSLTRQARGDIEEFFDIQEDGSWKLNLAKAKKAGLTPLIKKLKNDQFGVVLELYSSQRALEMIGKIHKVFVERREHTGPDGGAIQVQNTTLTDAISNLGVLLDGASPEEKAKLLQEYEQYRTQGAALRSKLAAIARGESKGDHERP